MPFGVGTADEAFIEIIMPSAPTNFVCLYDTINKSSMILI